MDEDWAVIIDPDGIQPALTWHQDSGLLEGYVEVINNVSCLFASSIAARINAGEDVDFDSALIQYILDEV